MAEFPHIDLKYFTGLWPLLLQLIFPGFVAFATAYILCPCLVNAAWGPRMFYYLFSYVECYLIMLAYVFHLIYLLLKLTFDFLRTFYVIT